MTWHMPTLQPLPADPADANPLKSNGYQLRLPVYGNRT
jgi:hypothetical protein